jgi:hypothetical protein
MQNKIQILYAPGSYGTYLAWSVYTYSNLNLSGKMDLPFGPYGSAHKFRKHAGFDIVHPSPTHDIVSEFTNFIFIQPVNLLEYTDNQFSKQADYNRNLHITSMFPDAYDKLQKNWTNSSCWEQRELLSFLLPDMFNSIADKFDEKLKVILKNKKVLKVNSDDILYNFELTLLEIIAYFKLIKVVNSDVINLNHALYMSQQKYIGRDMLIENLVKSIISKKSQEIPELTIFDQAMIQYKLREHGLELQCYELNKFPETTDQLANLTYKSN